jgi:hypothetical protein
MGIVKDHEQEATRRAGDVMRWLAEESDAVDVGPERLRMPVRCPDGKDT